MSPRRGRFFALLIAAALPLLPATDAGSAAYDRGELRLEFGGELRNLLTYTRRIQTESLLVDGSTQRGPAGLWLLRGRVWVEGVYKERFSGQLVYDQEYRTGTELDSLAFAIGDRIGTQTWLDADRTIHQSGSSDWRNSLYRAWLRYESDRFEITLGRQRIAIGVGRIWNPEDLFNPIFPLAIDAGQRIGQDALVARARIAGDLWAGFYWSPQDDPDDQRIAGRVEVHRIDFDAGLMAGRFEQDWVIGADFATNLGDAAFRFEATHTDLHEGDRVWQVVGSIDYTAPVGQGLYLLLEHLYNQNLAPPEDEFVALPGTDPETAVRVLAALQADLTNRITTFGLNQTALQVGYELTPLLRGDLLLLYDWSGRSAALAPVATYQLRSDLELAVGAQFFLGGSRASQFGDRPALGILRLDAYF